MPRFQPGTFERNFRLVESLQGIAAKKGCQPSQPTLAWLRAQGKKEGRPVIVPIPGSSSVERICENLTGVDLTGAELKELDALVKKHAITEGDISRTIREAVFWGQQTARGMEQVEMKKRAGKQCG